jgi:cell division protein FtsI/penicillin-binding protein 2
MIKKGKKKNKITKKIYNFFNKNNINFIFLFFVFFTFVLIFQLYKIQVINGEKNNEKVLAQTKGYSLSKVKRRGSIFFTNHLEERTAVALQNIAYTVAINPKYIKNSENFYQKISEIIEINEEEFLKKAKKKNDPYEEIAHKISEEKIEEIKGLRLKGIIFVKES